MNQVRILALLSALTILVPTTPNAGGVRHFPDELAFPRGNVEDADSGDIVKDMTDSSHTVNISVDQTLFDKSYTGINKVFYAQMFGPASLEQSVWYELRRDKLSNTRHYLNASGALSRGLANPRYAWVTPGLDWSPIVQYSNDRAGNNALTTVDLGPTAVLKPYGVGAVLRAGISGRRVDSLAGVLRVGEQRSSVGAYGAFNIGSEEEPLPFAPVYFYADGIGRQIENSSMTSLSSNMLGAVQVGDRDSMFVYGAATFFNGREGYLEGSADSRAAQFTETPWRVERNLTTVAGYKAARRNMFFPSFYYSVSENTLEFLNDTRKRDERTLRQTLSGAVSTDSAAGLYYSGLLSFEWRGHDKLFGKDMPPQSTAENIDSLEVNLWDYLAFDPRTAHSIAVRLPRSMRLKYDFGLSRFLTEYPNYYIKGRDTVTNKDDSDRRATQHRLALEYKNDSTLKAEVYGEITGYDLVFLRQEKSSGNRTDNAQKVGLTVEWSPHNALLITEAVSAEAKRGNFHFPVFHRQALQRPRYSRAVNSSLSTTWQTSPLVGLSCIWNIKFSDYGFWYGREYMEEIMAVNPEARVDYYAITSKSVYYTVDLAVNFRPWETVITAGNAFTGARDRNYSAGNYILANENGYSVKPYLRAAVSIRERVELDAHLSRTFVAGDDALGYWDFRLQAAGGF
ncbi:MAG: hypothetical protein LBB74_00790 [Chitinispirillales bacterium]|jgi:hypothetical protein|nr:hypothetical protein [Chitinispirillales bacterium]